MDIRVIDGALGLSGVKLIFEDEDLFGLKVGAKIIQIGDGRENGCFRTDTFKFPITYVGSIICKFCKMEKMYAFQIPNDGIETTDDIYFLYGSTGHELFTEHRYSKSESYMRFYTPKFIQQ